MDLAFTSLIPLLAQNAEGKYENPQLLGYAFVPLIVGAIIFKVCQAREGLGLAKSVKWAGLIPLVIGGFLGLDPVAKFWTDPLYTDMFGGGNISRVLHTLPVVMPFVGAAIFFLWQKLGERSYNREDI